MKIQRLSAIKEYLIHNKSATLTTLCSQFDVSINTIRSDINALEKEGFLNKVYGGVVVNEEETDNEVQYYTPTSGTSEAVDAIGKAAAKLIEHNDIVYMCSGKTVHAVLKYIDPSINFTIITNSLLIINNLTTMTKDNVKVMTTGGEFQRQTLSFVGIDTLNFLKNINITKLFMSADGISLHNGITNVCPFESEIKRILLTKNCNAILLATHRKFNKFSTFTICPLSTMNTLITDKELSPDYEAYCRNHETQIVYTGHTNK